MYAIPNSGRLAALPGYGGEFCQGLLECAIDEDCREDAFCDASDGKCYFTGNNSAVVPTQEPLSFPRSGSKWCCLCYCCCCYDYGDGDDECMYIWMRALNSAPPDAALLGGGNDNDDKSDSQDGVGDEEIANDPEGWAQERWYLILGKPWVDVSIHRNNKRPSFFCVCVLLLIRPWKTNEQDPKPTTRIVLKKHLFPYPSSCKFR